MVDTESDLSALTRTPSLSYYHTADEGTSSRGEDVTDISSPGEAVDEDYSVKTPYRDALDLPRELRLRCHIHLEEQYCRHSSLKYKQVAFQREGTKVN